MTTSANAGTGPGPITPDGCAVAFYALLPPAGEAEIVHAAVPPAASIRYTLGAIERDGPLLTATVEHQIEQHRWTHTFTARRLSEDELAASLRDAGFGPIRWLTENHRWLAAPAA